MSIKYRNEFFDEPRDPSRIKLSIYGKYLVPWASKVGSAARESTIWVVDGFAGPGAYQDEAETPGSPKLILELARQAIESQARYRIGCAFVEKKRSNWHRLRSLCDQYPDVGPSCILGDFWEQIDELSSIVSSEPLLLITDPFGVMGMDYKKLARLANASAKCDLIVTFVTSAVRRIKGQYPGEVEQAVGPIADGDISAADAFARNMSAVGNFLPGGRFPLRPAFHSAEKYELIVFSRSVHAYRIWNDLVTREWQVLRRDSWTSSAKDRPLLPGFPESLDELAAEEDQREAANEILEWTNNRSSFSRREMTDHFVVHRFAEYHSSTLIRAIQWLETLNRLERDPSSTRVTADARLWRVLDRARV